MTESPRVENTNDVNRAWDLLTLEVYTPQEAAEVLNLPVDRVLRAAFGGDLRAHIVGGDVVSVTRADLVAWLRWRERH